VRVRSALLDEDSPSSFFFFAIHLRVDAPFTPPQRKHSEEMGEGGSIHRQAATVTATEPFADRTGAPAGPADHHPSATRQRNEPRPRLYARAHHRLARCRIHVIQPVTR
jgi:hypothetical protein